MRPIQRYLIERGEFKERVRQSIEDHGRSYGQTKPVKFTSENYEDLSPEYIAMSYAEGEEVFDTLIKQYRKYTGPENFKPTSMSRKDYFSARDHLRLPAKLREIEALPKSLREKAGDLMVTFGDHPNFQGDPDQHFLGAGYHSNMNVLAFPHPDKQAKVLGARNDQVTARDVFAHEWIHFKQAMNAKALYIHEYHAPIAMYNAASPLFKWTLDFVAKRGNNFMFGALATFGIYVFEAFGSNKSDEFYKSYYNDPHEREAFSGMVAAAYYRMHPEDRTVESDKLVQVALSSQAFYWPFFKNATKDSMTLAVKVVSRYKMYQDIRKTIQDAAARGMKAPDIRKSIQISLDKYKVPKSTFSDWVSKGRQRYRRGVQS